jgi:putative spermidine/putrescine transport system substrate-binding protein
MESIKKLKTRTYVLILLILVCAIGGGYYYYEITKPKPPTELQVLVDVGDRAYIEKYVTPVMLEKYNIALFVEGGTAAQNLAKILAQKDHPVISVCQAGYQSFIQAKSLGLLQVIPPEKIPNLKDYPASLKDPDNLCIENNNSFYGMFYNSKVFEEKGWAPPDSWYDLFDPKYKDHVVISASSSGWAFELMQKMNQLEGGNIETNWDPGFAKLKELVPLVHSFPSQSSQIVTLVDKGEVWIGGVGLHTALTATNIQNVSMTAVIPKEGVQMSSGVTYIPKNAPNLEAAYVFINMCASPEIQAQYYKQTFKGPCLPTAMDFLTQKEKENYPYTAENYEHATRSAWEIYVARKDEFVQRYLSEIEVR